MVIKLALPPAAAVFTLTARSMTKRFGSVQQIQQTVRVAHELGREVANGKEARAIYRIGEQYTSIEQTLKANGMAPNRQPGQKGVPQRA